MICVSGAGLPGGSSAGIIFDTPRVPEPPGCHLTTAQGPAFPLLLNLILFEYVHVSFLLCAPQKDPKGQDGI